MLTGNEIKTRGVKAIDEKMVGKEEVGITVRGKVKYIILPVEKFDKFREWELDQALNDAELDIKEGRFVEETVDEHLKRLWND